MIPVTAVTHSAAKFVILKLLPNEVSSFITREVYKMAAGSVFGILKCTLCFSSINLRAFFNWLIRLDVEGCTYYNASYYFSVSAPQRHRVSESKSLLALMAPS